ncbi:Glutathione S-transferase L3 [Morella rubra]|uniref:Glutathione S-transferase L3 n=1 Tax=Morella rubra TaxID=262757 RepID=A0A6A1WFB3_9ROSI|nr:Glutathione S-transferase L3 [Morella rubra]
MELIASTSPYADKTCLLQGKKHYTKAQSHLFYFISLRPAGMFTSDPEKEQFTKTLKLASGPVFDHLEQALHKFDDGPFFFGQFSLVDIAYVPFVERFQIFLSEVWKYDITAGRPKLAKWIEEINKIDAYKQTKTNPEELVEHYKARFLKNNLANVKVSK